MNLKTQKMTINRPNTNVSSMMSLQKSEEKNDLMETEEYDSDPVPPWFPWFPLLLLVECMPPGVPLLLLPPLKWAVPLLLPPFVSFPTILPLLVTSPVLLLRRPKIAS